MILRIKNIVKKKDCTEYTVIDSSPIFFKNKMVGFAIDAIPNHFFKEVKECIEEYIHTPVPNLVLSFSVVKKKTGFEFKISF